MKILLINKLRNTFMDYTWDNIVLNNLKKIIKKNKRK